VTDSNASPITPRNETDNDPVVLGTPMHPVQEASQFAQATSADALKFHPLNRGTPLTIKKNKVARI